MVSRPCRPIRTKFTQRTPYRRRSGYTRVPMGYSEPPPEETTLAPAALGTPSFRSQPKLEWTDTSGTHSAIVSGRVLVGSAPGSGILIQHPTVSRLHAELEARADGLWIRDL